jgi:hypothetical protein
VGVWSDAWVEGGRLESDGCVGVGVNIWAYVRGRAEMWGIVCWVSGVEWVLGGVGVWGRCVGQV